MTRRPTLPRWRVTYEGGATLCTNQADAAAAEERARQVGRKPVVSVVLIEEEAG